LSKQSTGEAPKLWLILASTIFYGWWNFKCLLLLLAGVIFNYIICQAIIRTDKEETHFARKTILVLGILVDILLLGFFKYSNFLIANVNQAISGHIELLNLTLPIGISFFTFTQIACIIHIYNENHDSFSFTNYLLFVVFFPYLLSGPIAYYKEIIPQFQNSKNKLNDANMAAGLYLFSIGLFKKVVVGDNLAEWANNGFDASTLTFVEAWLTSISYTLQLYFDFSGYTDMALGSALFFNIKLPINFDSPYKSRNIQEFWRRWHITLGRFLRDHIYIPLGGNRFSTYHTIANILITFLICGLWHGAGWTFIVWGLLHGIGLVIHRLWGKLNISMPRIIALFITFNFVNIAWIFFRAKDFGDVSKLLRGMLGLNGILLPSAFANKLGFLSDYSITFGEIMMNIGGSYLTVPFIFFFLWICIWFNNSDEIIEKFRPTILHSFLVGGLFALAILHLSANSEFLYFRF
jgi:D-alanyl-lipoteichoic acid acyltransferase DltB (MBOAT superfamily)